MDAFRSPLFIRPNRPAPPPHPLPQAHSRSHSLSSSHSHSLHRQLDHPLNSPPSPSSSQNWIELPSDPLQQWLVFSPTLPNSEPPLSLPSMPRHDGRGRFSISTASASASVSPPHSDSEYSFAHLHAPPRRPGSLSAPPSEDGLLSIPSSLSVSLAGSRSRSHSRSTGSHALSQRSASPAQPATRPVHELLPDEAELLRTPMAESAGLAQPPPPAPGPVPASRTAALSFLATFASKLISVDADTLRMLSEDRARPAGGLEPSPVWEGRPVKRFALGDGDCPATTASVTPPMDLSALLPPSWRTNEAARTRPSARIQMPQTAGPERAEREVPMGSIAGTVLKKVVEEWTNW